MATDKFSWIFTRVAKAHSPIWVRPDEQGFVTEMSSWSGNGSPNPINGESMAYSRGQMQLDGPGADERNWLLRGEADGQKFVIRIYND